MPTPNPTTENCTGDRIKILYNAHYLGTAIVRATLRELNRINPRSDSLFRTYFGKFSQPRFNTVKSAYQSTADSFNNPQMKCVI